jgi:polar amino acid transport system substrate-binding protein
MKLAFYLLAFSFALAAQPVASPVPPALRAEFAPTGTLRAAINHANPLLAIRDPKTGDLSGTAVDLSRELGRRLGLPVQLIPFDAAAKISASARAGAWDVAFLAIDPARAEDIDYSAAYIELEGTYLVPAGSNLNTIEDVDRAGVRVSVTAKSGYDLFLTRALQRAELVRADTTPESIDRFKEQKLDAVAGVKTSLVLAAKEIPGSRVIPGHFMTIPQAVGLPKGRPAAVVYLRGFVEAVKASGFVADALKRHGMTDDDAVVAPPVPLR